jgi:hypothetical protein
VLDDGRGADGPGAYLRYALAAGHHPRLAELLTPAAPAQTGPPEAATDPAGRYRDILARILSGLLTPELR